MKIPFQNIGPQPKTIETSLEGEGFSVAFSGELSRKGIGMAKLEGTLTGEIRLTCDRCGESFPYAVDEKVTLKLTDTPHKSSEGLGDELDYDIIEFLDGTVDLDEIILSEVNAIKFDYHKCEKCN